MEVKDEDGQIRIDWREEGGPSTVPPTGEGFGSRLMQPSVERQLGGRMTRDWRPEGLSLSPWIPAPSMSRTPAGKDRKGAVEGKGGSVRVDVGGRRSSKKKKKSIQ